MSTLFRSRILGAQNENGTDRDWVVNNLRPTLNERGFRSVHIQAPDCDRGFGDT
jgi:galactosylceramidase